MDQNVHIQKILMVEDMVIISNRTDAVSQENDFLGPKQSNTKCIILYVNLAKETRLKNIKNILF